MTKNRHMTCIVGIANGTNVWMAGDLCGSDDYSKKIMNHQKVFKKDIIIQGKTEQLLIGYTTQFRMGQILEFLLDVPEFPYDCETEYEYLCKLFVPQLIKLFKSQNFAKIEDEEVSGGTFLIGLRGKLFTIQDDFSVLENAKGYDACGCGDSYAIPILDYLLENKNKVAPKQAENNYNKYVLIEALKQSAKHSPFVDYIENTKVLMI